jgi:hypothetical protein
LVAGWSCAALPTPTEFAPPGDVEDPPSTCSEVRQGPAWGFPEYRVLSGHFEETEQEQQVRFVCDDGSDVVLHGRVRVTGAPGHIRVTWRDMALWVVDTCMRCDRMPARHNVPDGYKAMWILRILAMALGVAGAWLFVSGWARRPFDPLEDMEVARRVGSSLVFVRPQADHLAIDGEVRHEPRLGVRDGAIVGQSEGPSQLVLPAASGSYRDGADGVHVVGPAKVLGLRARAGERAPIVDGDEVELPGHAPVRVSLPDAGVVSRFFARDENSIEVVGRVPMAGGTLRVRVVSAVLALGVVASLWDSSWAFLAGSVVLSIGLALTFALPRQLARRVVTSVDVESLARLEILHDRYTRIALDGRTLGWVPFDSSAVSRAIHLELERLVAHARDDSVTSREDASEGAG